MGKNVIGPAELKNAAALDLRIPETVPDVPFPAGELEAKQEDYLLVLGVSSFSDGTPVTIRNLRERFGKDPEVSEPCFYNQDWYLSEPFFDRPLDGGWHLVKKEVLEASRAVQPGELLSEGCVFPPAVVCAWTFFAWFFARGEYLWWHDFIWCEDTDHNGDRIYVGKYHDIDGINKNGFSVHRHLALRPCYAAVSYL